MKKSNRLTLSKETIRVLQDASLEEVSGGGPTTTGGTTITPQPQLSAIPDLCDPNWVGTSPPTQMC